MRRLRAVLGDLKATPAPVSSIARLTERVALLQVEVSPAQGEQLAAPQAGGHVEQDRRVEARVLGGLEQFGDLGLREGADRLARLFVDCAAGRRRRRVAGDQLPAHGLVESRVQGLEVLEQGGAGEASEPFLRPDARAWVR